MSKIRRKTFADLLVTKKDHCAYPDHHIFEAHDSSTGAGRAECERMVKRLCANESKGFGSHSRENPDGIIRRCCNSLMDVASRPQVSKSMGADGSLARQPYEEVVAVCDYRRACRAIYKTMNRDTIYALA